MSTLDKPWITPDSWSVCFGWDLPCIWSSWGSWLLWLSLHPQLQPPLQPLFPSLPSLCLCTLGEWNDCTNVNSPTFSQTQASLGPPRSHPLGLWHPLTTHWDPVPLKMGSCWTHFKRKPTVHLGQNALMPVTFKLLQMSVQHLKTYYCALYSLFKPDNAQQEATQLKQKLLHTLEACCSCSVGWGTWPRDRGKNRFKKKKKKSKSQLGSSKVWNWVEQCADISWSYTAVALLRAGTKI